MPCEVGTRRGWTAAWGLVDLDWTGLAGDGGLDGQWEVGCVQDLHVAYARDWGAAESCGRLRICNPANHRRPLSGQSTRQAAPKRNIKDTDIHRNNGAGEMRSLRLCTYHVPKKRPDQGCKHAGTSLPVPTSPQNRVRPSSRKIAGSLSSNLFHDLFI
jgi:hypothetical protein